MPPDICEVFFYLCVTILSHHEELSLHLVLLTQDRNVQDFPLTFRNILSPILHLFCLLKLSKTQESGLIRSHVKNPFFFEVLDKFPRFFFFLIHVTDYQFLLGPFVNCYRYFTYRLFPISVWRGVHPGGVLFTSLSLLFSHSIYRLLCSNDYFLVKMLTY